MFNVLVIIALSASCSNQALHIDWKPLSRDCLFYFVSIGLLVWFTESEKSVAAYVTTRATHVMWLPSAHVCARACCGCGGAVIRWEAACLVGWYACYIAFMTRNKEIFAWVDSVVDRVQQARLDRARNRRLRRLYTAKEAGDAEALARAAEAIRHHGDNVSHLSDLEEGSMTSDSNDVDNVVLALGDSEDDDELLAESEYELMERRAALRARFRGAVYAGVYVCVLAALAWVCGCHVTHSWLSTQSWLPGSWYSCGTSWMLAVLCGDTAASPFLAAAGHLHSVNCERRC